MARSALRLRPVRGGTATGSRVLVPASPDSDGHLEHEPPVRPVDYAALSAGWAAALATVLLASREKGEEPVRAAEIVPLGVATFALSKLVAKEKVDRWVREPFVEERPDGERRPKGRGMRYAVGELLTCTRCVGTWSALGLVALRVARPREARVVSAVLGASALNDWAQTGFNWACAKSNTAQTAATEAEIRAQRVGGEAEARFGR
jgi:Protein of unknown function (DUF1360)